MLVRLSGDEHPLVAVTLKCTYNDNFRRVERVASFLEGSLQRN